MKTQVERLKAFDGNYYDIIRGQKKEVNTDKDFLTLSDRFDISDSNLRTIHNLVFLGSEYDDSYHIPNYQRELVWTNEQKSSLILSILKGHPIGNFLFRKNEISEVEVQYYVIDGQQRINAIREFALGDLSLPDGRKVTDLKYRDAKVFFDYSNFRAFKIENLSEKDELEIYLEVNAGGTLHTEEEINKARNLLKQA